MRLARLSTYNRLVGYELVSDLPNIIINGRALALSVALVRDEYVGYRFLLTTRTHTRLGSLRFRKIEPPLSSCLYISSNCPTI